MTFQKQGFTLIEVMIAVEIFSVVTLVIGSLYILSQKTYLKTTNKNEIVQNARVCLDRMSREIRQSANLITDISSTTPSHEILFQDGHDLSEITYIKYYLVGTDLIRSHVYYHFPGDTNYVYFGSKNAFNQEATATDLSESPALVGEYFSNLNLTMEEGLIRIQAILNKQNENSTVETSTYIRNW